MREIRLTFNADDFGAVSKILVDMGIGFTVEPVREPEAEIEAAVPRATAPPTAPRRKAARKKPKAAAKSPSKRESVPVSGADRLREALTRRPADEPSPTEVPDRSPQGGANPTGDRV